MNTLLVPPQTMDAHTLGLLEFDRVRGLLAGYAASSLGKELAASVAPMHEAPRAREELALVTQMAAAISQGHTPPFGGLYDIRLIVRRAAIGTMLTPEQLLEVAETLQCTGAMYRYRMRISEKHVRLIEMLAPISDMGGVAKNITTAIDGRATVVDSASRELAAVRQKLADIDERIQNELKRLLRDPKIREILRYANATVSGEHYVLPVAANHRAKVPGVVHRTSPTGETVFIEPASISAISAERDVLKAEEEREVRRILRRLSGEIGKIARPLTTAVEVMGRLDFVTAKARYSADYGMSEPDVNDEGRLWLRSARHPLLEHLFRTELLPERDPSQPDRPINRRKAVPIEVRLGVGFNMLVITGPNTGGKTVTLKTTGLLSLMAMSGMHIPATEGSAVPVFRHVLADIGDEQSLQQSLSTFSSHITRIRTILEQADDKSLVLLDELGAGTDPVEGAALGRAILDALDDARCRAIVTTHLGDLKTYAFNNERAENGAVEFDVETLRPTYRLYIGQFGASNALRIAKRLKLPKELLVRAHKYLRRKKGKTGELARLQELREQAEKARGEALQAQHAADQQREAFEQKLADLEREQRKVQALKDLRQKLQVNDQVRVTRFDKPCRVLRVDHKKGTATVSVGIGQWEVPMDEIFPVGD